MIMKQTINEFDFVQAFKELRPNNFSRAGLFALYDYLEQLEDDIGEEIELDVIALCCEYAEYDSLAEFREDYGEDYNTMQDIEYHTTVIMIDNESFIIQQF